MENRATGFVETFGYTCAMVCADAAAKAADVKIVAIDHNRPAPNIKTDVPIVVCIKMEGSVSAVTAGVEAAVRVAESKNGVITSHIIARPEDDTVKLINRCSVGRDKMRKIEK